MEGLPLVFSIVGALFGLIATTLMGMCVQRLSNIEHHLEVLNGKVHTHLMSSGIHEAGLVRLEGEVNRVLKIAEIAHARAEKLEANIPGER